MLHRENPSWLTDLKRHQAYGDFPLHKRDAGSNSAEEHILLQILEKFKPLNENYSVKKTHIYSNIFLTIHFFSRRHDFFQIKLSFM